MDSAFLSSQGVIENWLVVVFGACAGLWHVLIIWMRSEPKEWGKSISRLSLTAVGGTLGIGAIGVATQAAYGQAEDVNLIGIIRNSGPRSIVVFNLSFAVSVLFAIVLVWLAMWWFACFRLRKIGGQGEATGLALRVPIVGVRAFLDSVEQTHAERNATRQDQKASISATLDALVWGLWGTEQRLAFAAASAERVTCWLEASQIMGEQLRKCAASFFQAHWGVNFECRWVVYRLSQKSRALVPFAEAAKMPETWSQLANIPLQDSVAGHAFRQSQVATKRKGPTRKPQTKPVDVEPGTARYCVPLLSRGDGTLDDSGAHDEDGDLQRPLPWGVIAFDVRHPDDELVKEFYRFFHHVADRIHNLRDFLLGSADGILDEMANVPPSVGETTVVEKKD